MDQWVGKSVNLLEGDDIVFISNNSWVNDNNDAETYEVFCSLIDDLSDALNCSGFEAEKQIFSIGGRQKGKWRKYLIENYKSKLN